MGVLRHDNACTLPLFTCSGFRGGVDENSPGAQLSLLLHPVPQEVPVSRAAAVLCFRALLHTRFHMNANEQPAIFGTTEGIAKNAKPAASHHTAAVKRPETAAKTITWDEQREAPASEECGDHAHRATKPGDKAPHPQAKDGAGDDLKQRCGHHQHCKWTQRRSQSALAVADVRWDQGRGTRGGERCPRRQSMDNQLGSAPVDAA